MAKIEIKEDICKGCGLCVNACPKKIMEIQKDKRNKKGYFSVFCNNQDACISCAMCATMCPDLVITVNKE